MFSQPGSTAIAVFIQDVLKVTIDELTTPSSYTVRWRPATPWVAIRYITDRKNWRLITHVFRPPVQLPSNNTYETLYQRISPKAAPYV